MSRFNREQSLMAPAAATTLAFSGELVAWNLVGRDNPVALISAGLVALVVFVGLIYWLIDRWLGSTAATVAALLPAGGLIGFQLATLLVSDGFPRSIATLLGGLIFPVLCIPLLRSRRSRRTVYFLTTVIIVALAIRSVIPRPTRDGRCRESGSRCPDIAIIVLDTTRPDRLSVYGYGKSTSPNLEQLASSGQVFENAWSVSPWTPPSHASMLTGLLPAEHGADGAAQPKLDESLMTLQEFLRQQGYATAGFIANPNLHASGWSQGFDRYEDPTLSGNHTFVNLLNRILSPNDDQWRVLGGTALLLRKARWWWSRNYRVPRFLFINLIDPHTPYDPPEEFFERLSPELSLEDALRVEQRPIHYHLEPGMSPQEARMIGALYDAEVAALDAQLGRFFEWLSRRGDLDDSIVIVTADHGERLGERGLVGHNLVMDTHLLKVPLIIRSPGILSPGRSTDPVRLDGLAGFVLKMAQLEVPAEFERTQFEVPAGGVLIAQYQHPDWYLDRLVKRNPSFDTGPYRGDWLFVSDGRFGYVASSELARSGKLIDLASDPDWSTDVSAEHPQVTSQLRAVADTLPGFVDHEPDEEPLDEDARRQLRALGYVD